MAGQRQFILILPADAELGGHVFSRVSHVVAIENVPEPIQNHQIDQLAVPHALAPAGFLEHIGRLAHVFDASGHHYLGIAEEHGLSCQHDGLET